MRKNTSSSYTSFEFNCEYYLQAFYKNNVNFYPWSKLADKSAIKLKEQMIVHGLNFQHIYKLEKHNYNRYANPGNYIQPKKFD